MNTIYPSRPLQGEVLEQQFGEEEAAFRTLDLYTSAVLESSLAPTKAPKPEWREIMAHMSKVTLQSCRCVMLTRLGRVVLANPLRIECTGVGILVPRSQASASSCP